VGRRRIRVVYRTKQGNVWSPWAQGEEVFLDARDLDRLVRFRTAFGSFHELVKVQAYRPTIVPRDAWDWVLIGHYDRYMKKLWPADPRRVYTGGVN
jgi:hypothetical protein